MHLPTMSHDDSDARDRRNPSLMFLSPLPSRAGLSWPDRQTQVRDTYREDETHLTLLAA